MFVSVSLVSFVYPCLSVRQIHIGVLGREFVCLSVCPSVFSVLSLTGEFVGRVVRSLGPFVGGEHELVYSSQKINQSISFIPSRRWNSCIEVEKEFIAGPSVQQVNKLETISTQMYLVKLDRHVHVATFTRDFPSNVPFCTSSLVLLSGARSFQTPNEGWHTCSLYSSCPAMTTHLQSLVMPLFPFLFDADLKLSSN